MPDETVKFPRAAEPEPPTAAERLRAFEDDYFGKNEVRIGGKVQRGHGSHYARLHPAVRAHYHALETAAEIEKEIADAKAAVTVAEEKGVAAAARVQATHKAVEKWPDKARA